MALFFKANERVFAATLASNPTLRTRDGTRAGLNYHFGCRDPWCRRAIIFRLAALLGPKRFEAMIDFGIREGPANPDPENRRQFSFRDGAKAWFYATIVLIALGGWLWFLGWLSWHAAAWEVGD
jgi:hypothetical protein